MDLIQLQNRTVQALEKTKKRANIYYNERKQLDQYLRESSKLNEWEEFLIAFEQKIGDDKSC